MEANWFLEHFWEDGGIVRTTSFKKNLIHFKNNRGKVQFYLCGEINFEYFSSRGGIFQAPFPLPSSPESAPVHITLKQRGCIMFLTTSAIYVRICIYRCLYHEEGMHNIFFQTTAHARVCVCVCMCVCVCLHNVPRADSVYELSIPRADFQPKADTLDVCCWFWHQIRTRHP